MKRNPLSKLGIVAFSVLVLSATSARAADGHFDCTLQV